MGCFPVLALLLVGFGVGYLVDGRPGALWGAGIGLVVGAIAGVLVMWSLRRMRHH